MVFKIVFCLKIIFNAILSIFLKKLLPRTVGRTYKKSLKVDEIPASLSFSFMDFAIKGEYIIFKKIKNHVTEMSHYEICHFTFI